MVSCARRPNPKAAPRYLGRIARILNGGGGDAAEGEAAAAGGGGERRGASSLLFDSDESDNDDGAGGAGHGAYGGPQRADCEALPLSSAVG